MTFDKHAGYKSITFDEILYYSYPCCGYESEMIHPEMDATIYCPSCEKKIDEKNLTMVYRIRPFAKCTLCNYKSSLSRASYMGRHICENCSNILAAEYLEKILSPKEILNIKWNSEMRGRSLSITKTIFAFECYSPKDELIMLFLHDMAKKDDSRFKSFCKGSQKAGIIFDKSTNHYLGYISWVERKNYLDLKQIFIVEEERRKGYATLLFNFWLKEFAFKISKNFSVESPNEKFSNILIKLGYARPIENGIEGITCRFTGGC